MPATAQANGSGAGASTDRRQHAIGRPGLRQGRADAASRPRHPAAGPSLGRAHLAGRGRRRLSTTAGARLQSGQAMGIRAGEGVTLAGSALSDTTCPSTRRASCAWTAARWLTAARCDWRAMTCCWARPARRRGRGIDITATRDLRASGSSVSAGAAQLKAGRDAALSGTLAADGDLKLQAGGAASSDELQHRQAATASRQRCHPQGQPAQQLATHGGRGRQAGVRRCDRQDRAGVDSKLQAKGALRLDAGKALTLPAWPRNAGMTLASGTDLRGRQRHDLAARCR